jgi:monoamine oxidase
MTGFAFLPFSAATLQPTGARKRVIVLGAGMSGLACAYMLVRAGHSVTVLEAKSHPGGRVLTLRDGFSAGLHADAGASFIPGCHTLSIGFAEQFGLPLDPIPTNVGTAVDYLRGTRVAEATASASSWPVQLSETESGKAPIAWLLTYVKAAMLEILAVDPRAGDWPPPALQRYDDISFRQFLHEQGASDGAIEILRLGYQDLWGNGIDTCSALLILRDTAYAFATLLQGKSSVASIDSNGAAHPASRQYRAYAALGDTAADGRLATDQSSVTSAAINPNALYRFRHGTDVLPLAIASHLGASIRYESVVSDIAQWHSGVSVGCVGDKARYDADYLICTLPFSVLRSIAVVPAFSAAKTAAIQSLQYTSVTRVFLEFTERFWQRDGYSGTAATDLPARAGESRAGVWIEDATAAQQSTRGILDCYFTGPTARELEQLVLSDQIELVLSCVEQVYPGARTFYSGHAMTKSWDADAFAKGDYCWYSPGQMTTLTPVIGAHEGRIHFAGDHTSALPGWIQGALESAVRVANEVNDAA